MKQDEINLSHGMFIWRTNKWGPSRLDKLQNSHQPKDFSHPIEVYEWTVKIGILPNILIGN